jgi:hypothetical protein
MVWLKDLNGKYMIANTAIKEGLLLTDYPYGRDDIDIAIKAKTSEIITSKYSIVWQLNHPRVDIAYTKDYEWIDNIREISNKAELNGTALENIDWGI